MSKNDSVVTLRISQELREAIERRAEKTEGSPEEFLRRAIALFFTGLDIEENGWHLAVMNPTGTAMQHLEGLSGARPSKSHHVHLSIVKIEKADGLPPGDPLPEKTA